MSTHFPRCLGFHFSVQKSEIFEGAVFRVAKIKSELPKLVWDKNKEPSQAKRAARGHTGTWENGFVPPGVWKFSLTTPIESFDYPANAASCNRRIVLPSIGGGVAFVARKKWPKQEGGLVSLSAQKNWPAGNLLFRGPGRSSLFRLDRWHGQAIRREYRGPPLQSKIVENVLERSQQATRQIAYWSRQNDIRRI
jgi:hypothetical protein